MYIKEICNQNAEFETETYPVTAETLWIRVWLRDSESSAVDLFLLWIHNSLSSYFKTLEENKMSPSEG